MRLLRRMLALQAPRVPGPDPYEPPHNPYDYDPHLGQYGGGYPGDRAPPPDLTDQAQILGLDPRAGDTEATHTTLNHPWGKVVQLFGDGKSITLVQTEAYPRPFPWAIQARFSLDGKTFTPTVPGTWGGDVIFRFIKSFDVKTGPAREVFDLVAGEALPICALIARKLTVTAQIVGESVLALWVQFVVCPTQQIDCGEASGVTPGAAKEGIITRLVPSTIGAPSVEGPGVLALPANPARKQFIVQNHATTNMYVALGDRASPPLAEGEPEWSILLPPAVAAGENGVSNYVSDLGAYTGPVTVVWDPDGGPTTPPGGDAMVTETV